MVVKTMAKIPLQSRHAQPTQTQYRSRLVGFAPGASLLMAIAVLAAWVPAASARPHIRVQSVPVQGSGYPNSYPNSGQVINFPAVVPFSNSIYSPVQTTIQPDVGGGLSVQIGSPTVYPSGVYPSGVYSSEYGYGQPGVIHRRGSVNDSVLINPTVINSPIRNSTLINPTIVNTPTPSGSYYTTPYYSPYYNTQTITTTTRPEPEVYIDPQYGVRYRSPAVSSEQQIIIYPR